MEMSERFKKITEYMDSEEGQADMKEYFGKIANRKAIEELQLKRFHSDYSHRMDELVEKVVAKYDSQDYWDRHYKRGYEAPTPLYFFFFEYAETYGTECSQEEYKEFGNMFTAGMYKIHNWAFNLMHGQGSVIHIHKLKPTHQ